MSQEVSNDVAIINFLNSQLGCQSAHQDTSLQLLCFDLFEFSFILNMLHYLTSFSTNSNFFSSYRLLSFSTILDFQKSTRCTHSTFQTVFANLHLPGSYKAFQDFCKKLRLTRLWH